jgi:acid phosphatase
MKPFLAVLGFGSALIAASHAQSSPAPFPAELSQKIQYVIVLYPENRSFDAVYGLFPGANGLAQAQLAQITQTDATGNPLPFLPQAKNGTADNRFPPGVVADRFGHPISELLAPAPNGSYLANSIFDINRFVGPEGVTGDMIHRFYTEQYQINRTGDPKNAGGAPMSKYAAWDDNPGLLMGYFDAQNFGEGLLAKKFVLCDNAFHSVFGGSFLNHQFLIAARSPVWPAKPAAPGAAPSAAGGTVFDSNGSPAVVNGSLSDGAITNDPRLPGFARSNSAATLNPGDYWAVNTLHPLFGPATAAVTSRLPLQTYDTIGDRLTADGISWAWFSGGWNAAKSGNADPLFQPKFRS